MSDLVRPARVGAEATTDPERWSRLSSPEVAVAPILWNVSSNHGLTPTSLAASGSPPLRCGKLHSHPERHGGGPLAGNSERTEHPHPPNRPDTDGPGAEPPNATGYDSTDGDTGRGTQDVRALSAARPELDFLLAGLWTAEPAPKKSVRRYLGRHHGGTRRRLWFNLALIVVLIGLAVVAVLSLLVNPNTARLGQNGAPRPSDGIHSVKATDSTHSRQAVAAVTIEAEAGPPQANLDGSAYAVAYAGASGGAIVRNLGKWPFLDSPGSIRFNSVAFPTTGSYAISLYVVHLDDETTRTAQLTITGLPPITVTSRAGSTCCQPDTVLVTVPEGIRTITITNAVGHAPALDKIVIAAG
jgi:hypothetical protein